MKAGFLFFMLSAVAVAQASYELSCAKSELGIRWPSYESNSEYFVCPRLFGKQVIISCNAGEVFTFALQSCTSPSRYIPAPPLEILPTATPLMSKPNKEGYLTPYEIYNDVHSLSSSSIKPSVHEMPVNMEVPNAPVVLVQETKHEVGGATNDEEPIKNTELLVPPTEQVQNLTNIAPLPPTPAPTPPVVAKKSHKKPHAPSGEKSTVNKKKKSSAKPSKKVKKPTASKKPAASKKPTAKDPKKLVKRPKIPAKKSPKS